MAYLSIEDAIAYAVKRAIEMIDDKADAPWKRIYAVTNEIKSDLSDLTDRIETLEESGVTADDSELDALIGDGVSDDE